MSENKNKEKTTYDLLCDAISDGQVGNLQNSEKLFIRLCTLVFEENGYTFNKDKWEIKENDNSKLLGLDYQKKILEVCKNIPSDKQETTTKIMSMDDISKNEKWLKKWGPEFINDFVSALKDKLPKTSDGWTTENIKNIFKKYGKPVIDNYTKKGKLSGFANIFSGYWSGLEKFANGEDKGTFEFIKYSCNEIKKSFQEKFKSKK